MGSDGIAAVVLAAGEGKRLRSSQPKVLHRVAGRPLLLHALAAVAGSGIHHATVVVPSDRAAIESAISEAGFDLTVGYATQDPPLGTGDAVRVALEEIDSAAGTVVVTNGDLPLLGSETIASLLQHHVGEGAAATILTSPLPPGTDVGRIIRTADGRVDRIVEVADATPEESAIDEGNAGVYVFDLASLHDALGKLGTSNAQQEYYLTDVIGILREQGREVAAHETAFENTQGVNDRGQLASVGKVLYRRTAERWMQLGVTIMDPSSTFIDVTVTIEPDATILPGTFLEGDTSIGAGAEVGPQSRIVDSSIASGASVTYAVVRGSEVGEEATVGPFASLRPGTRLGPGARLGTFVESKNVVLGAGSKAPHLSYLGDAEIGANVNIGAGTITCNWDGVDKHRTVIEDDAYISSDTMLVAPVHIGKRAATGAGAVVRDDVPDDALAVGVPARVIPGKGDRKKRG